MNFVLLAMSGTQDADFGCMMLISKSTPTVAVGPIATRTARQCSSTFLAELSYTRPKLGFRDFLWSVCELLFTIDFASRLSATDVARI